MAETKTTTMRLSEQSREALAEIRARHGLRSDAAAVEYLAAFWRDVKTLGSSKKKLKT